MGGIIGSSLLSARSHAREIEPRQVVRVGEPVSVAEISPGDWLKVGLDDPIYIRRRTKAQVREVRAEPTAGLADPARDEDRAPGDGEWLVVSGLCTHASCTITGGLGPYQGWMCLCHGSIYDLSGRVRHGPAKRNLRVIPHIIHAPGSLTVLSD